MSLTLTLYGASPEEVMADAYFRADYVALHARPDPIDTLERPGFRHAAAVRTIPGTDAEDMETPWGYGGPVARDEAAFWEGIGLWRQRQRDHGRIAEFVRLHPFLNPLGYRGWFDQLRFDRLTVLVDLSVDPALRRRAYSKGTRYSLRQAERLLTVRALEPGEAALFRRCYEEGLGRNSAERSYYFPADYYARLLEAPYATAWVVEREGRAVAVACFLSGGPFAHYHLSGGGAAARTGFAHYLLLEHAIEHYRARGCRFMHLGGGRSAAPDDDLLKFKRRFSSWLIPFYTGGLVYDRAAYDRLTQGRRHRFLSYRFGPPEEPARDDVSLDPATPGDLAIFFRIKCDIDNIVWSGHARPPLWPEMAAWYAPHMAGGTGRRIFIARSGRRTVGYAYLDEAGERLAVTIGLAAGEGGRGRGRALLSALVKQVEREGDARPLEAWIFPENLPTVHAFEAVGFVRDPSRAPKPSAMPLLGREPRGQHCWVRSAASGAAAASEARAG
ncbi:MAG: GNAT family N-acetyltransferase [Alphaproteobacteria bacterium]